jgi:23S rRNA (guanosine2251-2'-O)-methyltransferase
MEKLLAMKGDLSSSAREIIRMARDAGVVVQEVDKSRLDQVYPNHQGLLAYVSSAEYASVDDIFACAGERGEDPFIVVLDGVTDPHNLGAIIRSADCAGAHGVIIPERRSAGLNPACVKAAAGAVEYMRVARVTNLPRTLDELKEKGVWLYASDMDGESVYEADKSGPAAIVIGAEGEGVSRLVLEKCDKTLSIPMRGHVGSLNASVAAGIMLFEFARARR